MIYIFRWNKLKRLVFWLTIFLLCAVFSYADKVFLTNGSIIQGDIIYQTVDYVVIQTSQFRLTIYKDTIAYIKKNYNPNHASPESNENLNAIEKLQAKIQQRRMERAAERYRIKQELAQEQLPWAAGISIGSTGIWGIDRSFGPGLFGQYYFNNSLMAYMDVRFGMSENLVFSTSLGIMIQASTAWRWSPAIGLTFRYLTTNYNHTRYYYYFGYTESYTETYHLFGMGVPISWLAFRWPMFYISLCHTQVNFYVNGATHSMNGIGVEIEPFRFGIRF